MHITACPDSRKTVRSLSHSVLTMAASTPADSTAVMEAMFQPSVQLPRRNCLFRVLDNFRLLVQPGRQHERPHSIDFQLLPHLTPQDVLDTDISAEGFRRFLDEGKKVVAMTPGVIVSTCNQFGGMCPVAVGDGRNLQFRVNQMYISTHAMVTATCDFLVYLFANINIEMPQEGILIESDRDYLGRSLPVSGAALALLFQESRGNVRSVSLSHCILNEEHIRALSTESRPDMKVKLSSCELADSEICRNAFVECLQNNTGPTELHFLKIDYTLLIDALRGNTRVNSLHLGLERDEDQTGQGELFRALAGNRGLVEVSMAGCIIDNGNWAVLCESLQGHPTLTSLFVGFTCPWNIIGNRVDLSEEEKRDRSRMVAEMIRENTILHTIDFREDERDEQIYTEAIRPHLVTNRYRPRVLAVTTETRDRQIREKVLGRALYSVRSDPNLVWMFLSNNVYWSQRVE
jgi:hypothetical protein